MKGAATARTFAKLQELGLLPQTVAHLPKSARWRRGHRCADVPVTKLISGRIADVHRSL
jgi:hypothetical protein